MILSALLSLHSTAQRPVFLLDTEVSLQGHAEAFKCLQAEDVFEFVLPRGLMRERGMRVRTAVRFYDFFVFFLFSPQILEFHMGRKGSTGKGTWVCAPYAAVMNSVTQSSGFRLRTYCIPFKAYF